MAEKATLHRRSHVVATGALTLGLIVAVTGTAVAEQIGTGRSPTQIDLTEITVAIINLAFPLVAAVATYIINSKVKDQQMATLLANAVTNGVGEVQRKLVASAREARPSIEISDPAIAAGVNYIKENAQEAIKHFNVPDERLAAKLLAKLGLVDLTGTTATLTPPAPTLVGAVGRAVGTR